MNQISATLTAYNKQYEQHEPPWVSWSCLVSPSPWWSSLVAVSLHKTPLVSLDLP